MHISKLLLLLVPLALANWDRDDADEILELIEAFEKKGKHDEALQYLKNAVDFMFPHSAMMWLKLLELQIEHAMYPDAFTYALKCNATLPANHAARPKCLAYGCYARLSMCDGFCDVHQVCSDAQLFSNGTVSFAERLYGSALQKARKVNESLVFFERAYELTPNYDTLQVLCLGYLHAGNCSAILECVNKAIEMKPDGDGVAAHLYNYAIPLSICYPDDPRAAEFRMMAAKAKTETFMGLGCSSFKFKTAYPKKAWRKRRVLAKAGKSYSVDGFVLEDGAKKVAQTHTFQDKEVSVVKLTDVFLQTEDGLVFEESPKCVLYSGDHFASLPLQEQRLLGLDEDIQPTMEDIMTPTVSILGMHPNNYYHAVIEQLGKLAMLSDTLLGKIDDLAVLVPRGYDYYTRGVKHVQKKVDFETIQYPQGNNRYQVYHFDELYVVDWRGEDAKTTSHWATAYPPRSVLKKLADVYRVRKTELTPADDWLVLYAGRRNTNVRALEEGEEQIIAAIKAVAGKEHFRTFYGTENFDEQREIMSKALAIVGPHGAALANSVFMPPKAAIVNFPLEPRSDECFANIAAALDYEYWEIPTLTAFYYNNYTVTENAVAQVSQTLSHILAAKGFKHACTDSICQ